MSTVRLYEHPLSPYAQKNKIALREKSVAFEALLPTGVGVGSGYEADFFVSSPRAEVPSLVHGGVRVFDSTIILEYLEDAFPTPTLLPTDPRERARARMIEELMDTHYEAINWALSEIRNFRRAEGELASRLEEAAAKETAAQQAWLSEQLGSADWFGGERFGWADLSVVPYIAGSVGFGLGPSGALGAWFERCRERPSVASTLAEAAAAAAGMQGVAELVSKGLFKRQYRDHRLEWMVRNGGIEIVQRGLENDDIRFTHFPPSESGSND